MRYLLLLILPLAVSAADLHFAWDPNAEDEEITAYRLYMATNVAGPFVLVANAGTNTTATITNALLGQAFYYVTASNFWFESLPSDTVHTPKTPSFVQGTTIQILSIEARKYVAALSLSRKRSAPLPYQ